MGEMVVQSYNSFLKGEKPLKNLGFFVYDLKSYKVVQSRTNHTQTQRKGGAMMSEQDEIQVNAASSLTAEQICKFAKRDEQPTSGMCYIDWLLWYMVRDIYNEHGAGLISAEQGAKRKQSAVRIWEREWECHQRNAAITNRAAELWKSVEEAATAYRKNRTIQNADLLMVAIYGIAVNEWPDDQSGGAS